MLYTRMTQKGQTTIPADIRKKLSLETGDLVGFAEVRGEVVLKKVPPTHTEAYLASVQKTLEDEWLSPEDAAYDDL